jgi:glycosyltransferase involved in cell wall biosynthesis
MRGGEKVLEALCEVFPEADVYTNVYSPEHVSETIRKHRVYTSFIQKLPFAIKWYQKYLPLMPFALEQLDLSRYDLVISSESGPAKGVILNPETLHICYCHTPMRYIWDMYHEYRQRAGRMTRFFMPLITHWLRIWDVASANRVDVFVANSEFVAKRIRKNYRREAVVIPPPVDTLNFRSTQSHEDFYLVVGQLVPYKRVDIAVEAFNEIGKRLVIIGSGSEEQSLRKQAQPNIEFLSSQPNDVLVDYYSRCRALVFPGKEDFGIVPVEAMASGKPVIASRLGGALDTVVDGETGILFEPQTPQGLIDAINRFEALPDDQFCADKLRQYASRFSIQRFKDKIEKLVRENLPERMEHGHKDSFQGTGSR